MRQTRFCVYVLLAFAVARAYGAAVTQPAPANGPDTVTGDYHVDMKEAVEFLASDALEGRFIGTPGIERAGEYVADRFNKLRLRPLPGRTDYFQEFKMTTATAPGPTTALKWGETSYRLGSDFAVASFSGEATFDGPVVFVGYGISSSEHAYDDYAGTDMKGKIALAMRFEPHDAQGSSRFGKGEWSSDATLVQKAKAASEHGAVALVLVNPPTFHMGAVLLTFARQFNGERVSLPVLQVSQPVAETWLRAGGAPNLKVLQAAIDSTGKPESVELKAVRVAGAVAIGRTEKQVRNVLAMLPGAGPLADQYVFIGAHYDHLGHGGVGSRAPGSHAIFNGADDNASGTAAMLKLADHFAHAGPQPRTLVFAAWTAEEEGLIGSAWFTSHPLVPLGQIVADVNLDMVGRMRNNILYIGGAGTAADFDALLKRADEGIDLDLKSFGRGGLGPSDHMSFALRKIPVLFLFSGLHADYHRPSDKASKINYQGMERVVEFAAKIVTGIEDLPRETYIDASDATGGMQLHRGSGGGPGASLGVVPDYSGGDDQSFKGVRLSGTVPGSPAERAGLKESDIIVQFGKDKVDTLYDLSDELGKATPGEQVSIGIVRGKQRLDLQATLTARKSD